MPSIKYNSDIDFNPSPFEFIRFTPTRYEQKPVDYSLLAQSIATRENNMNNASKAKTDIDLALGKIQEQLHDDPETKQWFADYKQDIENQINDYASIGDFGNAFRTATELAGKTAKDPALMARLQANTRLKELKDQVNQRIGKGVSQTTADWYIKKNLKYNLEELRDENGNVIGGHLTEPEKPLYDDINFAGLAQLAANLIKPQKGSTGSSRSTSVANKTGEAITRDKQTYSAGESIGSGSSSDNQYERIDVNDILVRMDELVASLPGGYDQIEQAFQIAYDEYSDLQTEYEKALEIDTNSETAIKLKQQLDYRNQLMRDGTGSIIDYKTYVARMISDSLFAKGQAYDWRFTKTSNEDNYSIANEIPSNNPGGNQGDEGGYYQNYDTTDTVHGPNLREQVGWFEVNEAGNSLMDMFNNNSR